MGDLGCGCNNRGGSEWIWIIIAVIVIACLSGDGFGGLFGGGGGCCNEGGDFPRC